MHRLFFLLLAAGSFITAPHQAAAQADGSPVQTTARTQFVFKDGEVLRREGSQTTALTQNVRLAGGVKINYKNGMVEMPPDKLYPRGKIITLHEGDFVRADGGVVFATPGSAAAARGEAGPPPGTTYTTYVQHGPGYTTPAAQVPLLNQKIALLTQKINLLSQGRTDLPDTKAIDAQLIQLETQLPTPK